MFIAKGKHILDNRVDVTPSPAVRGRDVMIRYNGLLAKSGADRVYVHYGFDGWKNVNTAEMRREPDGSFAISLPVQGTSELNFCFKDSANNWDNNNGWNWASDIIY
ncbi:carbohydrate-binding protein [Thermodesulfitimonas autotrophica]|uniref:carbohydrate-binding protein n=1 Tax=Thermodesulfitimonas autotrophica TaxID=1894989 RepID=UPI002FDFE083